MKKNTKTYIRCLLFGMATQLMASGLMNLVKDKERHIEKEPFGNPYDMDYTISEKLSYEDIYQNLKIVTIEQEGTISKHLMYKIDRHCGLSNSNIPYNYDHYMDLEDDTQLLSYKNTEVIKTMEPMEKLDTKVSELSINIFTGEKGTILSKKSLAPYLMQANKIQKEYDVNELTSFYSQEVKPLIEEVDKPKKAKIKR